MTGIPSHREPRTEEEREVAIAMKLASQALDDITRRFPDLPATAIGAGFINLGVQIGCRHEDPITVAEYLRDVASTIAPPH